METTVYVETDPSDSGKLWEMTGGGIIDQLAEKGEAPLPSQQPPEIELESTLQTPLLENVFFGDFTEPWLPGLRHPVVDTLPPLSPQRASDLDWFNQTEGGFLISSPSPSQAEFGSSGFHGEKKGFQTRQ
jgi:hypothetical protein